MVFCPTFFFTQEALLWGWGPVRGPAGYGWLARLAHGRRKAPVGLTSCRLPHFFFSVPANGDIQRCLEGRGDVVHGGLRNPNR